MDVVLCGVTPGVCTEAGTQAVLARASVGPCMGAGAGAGQGISGGCCCACEAPSWLAEGAPGVCKRLAAEIVAQCTAA